MALKGPTPDDLTKLHAEINQIGNQRFVVTTLAVTFFGALLTIMISKPDPSATPNLKFIFTMSIVLSVVLFALYLWNHLLKNMMRVLTSYLAETKTSDWESDWKRFREEPYFAHTKPQTIIFMILNFVGVVSPFVLAQIYSASVTSDFSLIALVLIIFAITELLIFLMGFCNFCDNERKIRKRWQELQKADETNSQTNSSPKSA